MTIANLSPKAKPPKVRAIFILNALKIVLCTGFFVAFKWGGLRIGDLGPEVILHTLIAYIVFFAGMVAAILRQNIVALRVLIALDFASSVPAKAGIGFLVGIASMSLSFTAAARQYFAGEYEPEQTGREG